MERKYPDKPVRPGSPALHEFEYIRHGTISLITFLRVADGRIQSPYLNSTRNEEDFCNAVGQLIAEDADKSYIIFITHRMSSCRFCDDILVFDSGGIAERGNHEELLEGQGLYAALWSAQANYYQEERAEN